MRFLKNLPFIDVLIFLTFLPLLFSMPVAVKVFTFLGVYLAYKKKTFLIAVLGALAIFLSFGFDSLMRFDSYVLFLSSLLIWGVLLQISKRESRFLTLSVFLFFGFSIILFQNVYMLFYSVLEEFLFLYFFTQQYSKTPVKTAFSIFLYSLPLVLILFLFFPRATQKHFFAGFKGEYAVSGFSGVVNANTKSVKLLNIPVLELKLPKDYGRIYLKGAVFYRFVNGVWVKSSSKDKLVLAKKLVNYYLKEYPNGKRVIFGVDLALKSEVGMRDGNFIFHTKPVKRTLFIKMTSALKYIISPITLPKSAYEYDKKTNLYAQKLIKPLLKIKNEEKRVKKLIQLFKSQKIIYSTKVGKIDGKNIIDELFSKKKGFCVHFASAFALASRIAGLPSRLVGGYAANTNHNGYYKIYAKNAHAWVEVLVDGVWKRIDPSDFAYKIVKSEKTDKFSFYLSYVKFLIEEWVLRYNAFKQKKFLKFLNSHGLEAALVLFSLVFLVFFLVKYINQKRDLLYPLYKKLGEKPQNESVYRFLKKYNDPLLDEINELYNRVVFYKSTKSEIKKLKKLIKKFKEK